MDLRGRTALVTGGARRVGRAVAVALGREGMRVAVHFNTSEAEARETARLVEDAGGEARVFQGDLDDAVMPDRLIDEVTTALGGPALLVNSAAVYEESRWPVSDEAWQRHLDTNLTVPMRLIRAATPALRTERGAVVNIADACWQRPTWTSHVAYCVSKVALVGLTQNLARTLAPEIRVNAAAPGATLPPQDLSEEQRARAIENVPLQRWGTAEDVAKAVVFAAKCDFLTGQVLDVDGGRAAV